MSSSSFNATKADGGWIIDTDSDHISKTKVVVKDSEVIKQFKEFVEQTKPQTLNEG